MEPLTFEFRVGEFDLALLPIDANLLRSNPEILSRAIVEYLTNRFCKLGGKANVVLQGERIGVTWLPSDLGSKDALLEYAVKLLSQSAYSEAEPILRGLLKASPEDFALALNLGMMLSDQRRLDEAIPLLESATRISPKSANAWNAIGVAYQRGGKPDQAITALRRSHELEPDNPYTLRNLGALLADQAPEEALRYFRDAADLNPKDQQTLYGLGLALLRTGSTEEADNVLKSTIELAPFSEIAELCRSERTKLSHSNLRGAGGQVRMDVVMYITSALDLFNREGQQTMRSITFEIAMLGRSGLDINDPAQKYSLKSLPGRFSGLHLVAIMYAGMKQLAPDQEAGIDFGEEYRLAQQMRSGGKP